MSSLPTQRILLPYRWSLRKSSYVEAMVWQYIYNGSLSVVTQSWWQLRGPKVYNGVPAY